MMVTPAPLHASSPASTSADVLLPQPPFGLAKTIVGMAFDHACRLLTIRKQVVSCSPTVSILPPVH
jgi:hypothetical protein